MKRNAIIIVLLFPFCVAAEPLTYEQNGVECANHDSADCLIKMCTSKDEDLNFACILIMRSFIDGYYEGAGAGAFSVYGNDPIVFNLVKNKKVDDIAMRVSYVTKNTICFNGEDIFAIVKHFVKYVEDHPEIRNKSYRQAMVKTIQWRCSSIGKN